MAQPGHLSRTVLAVLWFLVGGAMVAAPAWVGWTRWEPVLNGHPALLIAAIACLVLGLIALVWAVASLAAGDRADREDDRPGHPRQRTPAQMRRRAQLRIALAVPALMLALVLVGVVAWSRPFPASAQGVAASRSSERVRVTDTLTWYELTPTARNGAGDLIQPKVGLVFTPGARVDPRAYAPLLAPFAEAGNLVIVLKDPFGIALADPNHAARAIAVHPEIVSWVTGGHSLGGTGAAAYADSDPLVKGLVLWASYPARQLARTDLKVLSVVGSEDGLATPAEVQRRKADLPGDTRYVEIAGGTHAFFGDYGEQPGDGVATVGRAAAQEQIVAATREFLAGFAPPPPKKKK